MTLNVVTFPNTPVADIAGMARQFADQYEAGKHEARTAIIVLDGAATIEILNWGDNPSIHAAIGILETAKQYLVSQLLGE